MKSVDIYLNFYGDCEAAFDFYSTVFESELESKQRFCEMPPSDDMPPMPENEKDWILHVALKLTDNFRLMGSDMPTGFGELNMGNNTSISLQTSSREETDKFFAALSEGGKVTMPLQDMFWGDYFGSCKDRFGINWMVNCLSSDT